MHKNKTTLQQTLFLRFMLVVMLCIGVTSALWIHNEVTTYREQLSTAKSQYVEAQKNKLENSIKWASHWIHFEKQQAENTLKQKLLEKIKTALRLTQQLTHPSDTRSKATVKKTVSQALMALNQVSDEGHFFIFNSTGDPVLWPMDMPAEPHHPPDQIRQMQASVFTTMKNSLPGHNEIFSSYTHPDHQNPEIQHQHLIYYIWFKPLGWFIGVDASMDSFTTSLQKRILYTFESFKDPDVGYIFIGQWDGLTLAGPGKGKNNIHLRDKNGTEVVQGLIDVARRGGGFVSYIMPEVDGRAGRAKLSYAAPIKAWKWYIGAGVYMDQMNTIIAHHQAELKKDLMSFFAGAGIIIGLLILITMWISRRIAHSTSSEISSFSEALAKGAHEYTTIPPDQFRFKEFQLLAETANHMIHTHHASQEEIRNNESLLLTTLNSVADGILVVSNQRKAIIKNTRFAEMWQIPKDVLDTNDDKQLLASVVSQLQNPDHFFKTVESLYSSRQTSLDQVQLKGGRIFERFSSPLMTNNVATGRVWNFRDITPLQSAIDNYQALFESALDPVFTMYQKDLKIHDVNQAALSLFGYSKAEYLAKGIEGLSAKDGLYSFDNAYDLLERVKKSGKPHFTEWAGRKKDGTLFDIEARVKPIIISEAPMFLVSIRDITARKKAEAEREKAYTVLSAVIDQAPYGILVAEGTADSGKITIVNQMAETIHGIPREDQEGLIFGKEGLQPPEIDPRWAVYTTDHELIPFHELPLINAILTGRPTQNKEVIIKRPDETYIHLLSNAQAIYNADGSKLGGVSITQDISAIKLAEKRIRESEENLHITLNSIGDAVIATDASGLITRMNPVAEALTGWPLAEAVGQSLEKVFSITSAQTGEPLNNPLHRIIEKGERVENREETLLVSRDGHSRRISDSGAPIRDEKGNIYGVVFVFRDITHAFELQAQLRQSQKMESIGHLAGGIAHDFNNMLAGIIGAAEMLALMDDKTNEKNQKYINLILSSGEQAADLTRKLLAFSRKGNFKSIVTNPCIIVQQVVDILTHTIDKKINVACTEPDRPVFIDGDPSQIQNAILNLALNARDAMPDGGTLSINVAPAELDQEYCDHQAYEITPGPYVQISVSDTGEGMDKHTASRIFEPFFTTKEFGKGTGLGLAAVYGTVKAHRGSINVYSEPGKGTLFHIYLPEVPRRSLPEKPQKALQKKGSGHVLVIDDDTNVRLVCAAILERLGYKVTTAEDGDEGMTILDQAGPSVDMVILDLIMPNKSGKEIFQIIREKKPTLPVLLASGFSMSEEVQEMTNNGPTDFLLKPFREAVLADHVSRLIQC